MSDERQTLSEADAERRERIYCLLVMFIVPALLIFPFTRPFAVAASIYGGVVFLAVVARLLKVIATWGEATLWALLIALILTICVPVVQFARARRMESIERQRVDQEQDAKKAASTVPVLQVR